MTTCNYPPCSKVAKYEAVSPNGRTKVLLCAEHTIDLDRMRLGWEINHRPVVDLW